MTATNFKQSTLPRFDVHASDRLRRDFTLQLGDRTDVVTVQIEPGNVQSESAEIRDVIGHQQVIDLPVKSRQFLDLAMLSPGVVRPPGGTRGDAMQQGGNLVSVLGQRSGHNLYLLHGVAITDEHFNNMVIAPSIDAIEEFNMVREESGLAMSSRNTLLSEEAHDKAAHLFRALTTASSYAEARAVLEAQGFRVEYVEERWARRLAAVNLEGVRLIDNVPVAEIRTLRFLG